jgi:hypothetical protein
MVSLVIPDNQGVVEVPVEVGQQVAKVTTVLTGKVAIPGQVAMAVSEEHQLVLVHRHLVVRHQIHLIQVPVML